MEDTSSKTIPLNEAGAARFPTTTFMKPESILDHLKISNGMTMADLGSGNGYMTLPAARLIGANGIIYAVDVVKEKLQSIKGQAQLFGLPNVVTVWADLEVPGATKIPDQHIDVTLVFNTLFQMKDITAVLKEAVRITKKGGKVAVTEWANKKYGFGPNKEHLVSDEKVKEIAKKIGLTLKKEHEADDFHYLLEFTRD